VWRRSCRIGPDRPWPGRIAGILEKEAKILKKKKEKKKEKEKEKECR
jgi:hypothetical protein